MRSVIWPNAVPLAQAYGQETMTNHVVVWANTYGSGRVFGTTLGHANATVGHPVYLDLVTRGLLWVCGKLDDASVFRITGVQRVTNSVWVAWESVPGWSYAVEAMWCFAPINCVLKTDAPQRRYDRPIRASKAAATNALRRCVCAGGSAQSRRPAATGAARRRCGAYSDVVAARLRRVAWREPFGAEAPSSGPIPS